MSDITFIDFLSVISIGFMVIGLIFYLLGKEKNLQRRGLAVFTFGSTILVSAWLLQDPIRIQKVRERIAYILIGVVIGFLKTLLMRRQE